MIRLGVPPRARLEDLRGDGFPLPPLRLCLIRHGAGLALLLGGMVEDGAAVLGARVGALPVLGRGVVHAVEELEQGGVGEAGGVEGHLEGFRVWRSFVFR